MMVARTRDTSRVTWGALLLLAQLLAFGILPSLHMQAAGFHGDQAVGLYGAQAVAMSSAGPDAGSTDSDARPNEPDAGSTDSDARPNEPDTGSTESGNRGGHDESTCQFCRIADSRYSPAVGGASTLVTRTELEHAPDTAGSWLRTTTLHPAHGPRPPPLT
jgi:hypothetical protein